MFGSRQSASRRPALTILLASACACAAVVLAPRQAHAGPNIGKFDLGIDGDLNALLSPSPNQNNLATMGSGFKIRFGDHFRMRTGLNLGPEVGYAFDHVFPGTQANLVNGTPENMNRIFAGLRVGFGKYVVPTLYGHIGYGFRTLSGNNNVNAGIIPSSNGLALDTGVAVEFRVANHLSLGPHAEFVYINTPTAPPQWLTFGAHLDFIF